MKHLTWTAAYLLHTAVLPPPPARAGTLFIASAGQDRVEEYNAANGTASNLNFIVLGHSPAGLALDSANNHLFVVNDISGDNKVSEFNATSGALIATAFIPANLDNSYGVAVGSGHMFVATGTKIGEYDAVSGAFIQTIDFAGSSAYGMYADSSGHLFVNVVIDAGHTVREYNSSTGQLINPNFTNALGSPPNDPSLGNVTSFAEDGSGDLFLSPFTTITTVREFSSAGVFIRNIGTRDDPFGLALDNSGDLFVSYNTNNLVEKYSASTGALLNATFISPTGVGPSGMVFVPSPVPEPSSLILAALGVAGMGVAAWQMRRKGTTMPLLSAR